MSFLTEAQIRKTIFIGRLSSKTEYKHLHNIFNAKKIVTEEICIHQYDDGTQYAFIRFRDAKLVCLQPEPQALLRNKDIFFADEDESYITVSMKNMPPSVFWILLRNFDNQATQGPHRVEIVNTADGTENRSTILKRIQANNKKGMKSGHVKSSSQDAQGKPQRTSPIEFNNLVSTNGEIEFDSAQEFPHLNASLEAKRKKKQSRQSPGSASSDDELQRDEDLDVPTSNSTKHSPTPFGERQPVASPSSISADGSSSSNPYMVTSTSPDQFAGAKKDHSSITGVSDWLSGLTISAATTDDYSQPASSFFSTSPPPPMHHHHQQQQLNSHDAATERHHAFVGIGSPNLKATALRERSSSFNRHQTIWNSPPLVSASLATDNSFAIPPPVTLPSSLSSSPNLSAISTSPVIPSMMDAHQMNLIRQHAPKGKRFDEWTVEEVVNWIRKGNLFRDKTEKFCEWIIENDMDGEALLEVYEQWGVKQMMESQISCGNWLKLKKYIGILYA